MTNAIYSYNTSTSMVWLPKLGNLEALTMDNNLHHKGTASPILLCFFLIFISLFANGMGNEEQVDEEKKTSVLETMLSRMFPLLSAPFPAPSTSIAYWDKAKTLINRLQAHFFPPNLDFRGSEEAKTVVADGDGGEGGAMGEKMKEAVAKSFGESKATVEDSAKSAARLAVETVHKTAEKLKRTLSESDHNKAAADQLHRDDDQSEL